MGLPARCARGVWCGGLADTTTRTPESITVSDMGEDNGDRRQVKGHLVEGGRRAIRAFGMASAGMRPDPDLLVIGAKRGGSTSFYFDLVTHPQVALLFPRPERIPKTTATKGIHYFDSNYQRGRLWCASTFRRTGSGVHKGRSLGPRSWYGKHRTTVCSTCSPRNALCGTHHTSERTREGREPLPLLEALLHEDARVGSDHHRLIAEPTFYSYANEHQTYLGQSGYGEGIDRWLQFLLRSQFHPVRSEDHCENSATALDGAAAHLGIDLDRFEPGPPRNAAPGDATNLDARDFSNHDSALVRSGSASGRTSREARCEHETRCEHRSRVSPRAGPSESCFPCHLEGPRPWGSPCTRRRRWARNSSSGPPRRRSEP